MSDEASRKRAEKLREQIAALRRGEKPKPQSIRDAVEEAAEKAREEAERTRTGDKDEDKKDSGA